MLASHAVGPGFESGRQQIRPFCIFPSKVAGNSNWICRTWNQGHPHGKKQNGVCSRYLSLSLRVLPRITFSKILIIEIEFHGVLILSTNTLRFFWVLNYAFKHYFFEWIPIEIGKTSWFIPFSPCSFFTF